MVRLAAVLIACLPVLVSGATASDAPHLVAVDNVVEPYVGRDTPGLAVLVMSKGTVLHKSGYGFADIDAERPVTAQTIFDLASVSKEMTALAARLQMQDGLYDEDTAVADILPVFADQASDDRAIVVGDLIHHVSGLTDYINADEESVSGTEATNAVVVNWLADQPLDHAPGTQFDYSNSGYVTLGSLVAMADGADSLNGVLHARIWDDLGMESTNLVVLAEGVDPDRMATGYSGLEGDFELSHVPSLLEGDGNVLTCLDDLALYETALSDGSLLDEQAIKTLFENGTLDDGSPINEDGAGYGYGWGLETWGGDQYATHSGSWMGTSTYYQRNLDTGMTVILLANGEDISLAEMAVDVEAAAE
ncbi:serine hydrolase domain-containing protein [Devosia sp. FKR38]|uniref:serine hydrolase domain-containing protein n=1 Tax=Devosia sp. FKR38 TaxID=2562312 RepID=UPI0010C0244D|nr:serine hydrolase domain-containing protein [Devosia sp. FKR38]